jgi:alpha-mannosidase
VRMTGTGIEIPTLLMDDKHLLIRLFNAEGDASERSVMLMAKPSRVALVELDGRLIHELPVEPVGNEGHGVKLAIPRFGLRTLRCEF